VAPTRPRPYLVFFLAALAAACSSKEQGPTSGEKLAALTKRIMAADYEGDRAALDRLYGETDAFLADASLESRARYWKGYTKWRRAMNGANETPAPGDLATDSLLCADEMQRASKADAGFVDARVGEMACLGLSMFFDPKNAADPARVNRLRALYKDLEASAADQPRYVWAWGMAAFGAPPERGGGPENVIRAYQRALSGMKQGAGRPASPLDPSWGEPELNVNLAYSYFNRPDRDLARAREYVDEAVRLAPNWHYAKDILRPQIEAAIGGTPASP
jgi:hypothetical protein